MSKKPFTWINNKLEERESPLGGLGTFATEKIESMELLMIFGGYVMSLEEESTLPEEIQDIAIQVEKNYVIGPIDKVGKGSRDYVNHSCNPNSGIRGQISLYAMRPISSGEEITFDYGTVLYGTGLQVTYEMSCNCNAANCRKKITDQDWRDIIKNNIYGDFLPTFIIDAARNSN
ncbi:MAG TPA: SET domain-containing protein-lysine N-methyltransferase [Candidatus Paceibacterota bacterium]